MGGLALVSTTDTDQGTEPPVTTCYRHPKRETYVRCTRCDRFICPDCMREAAVGHHCPECVKEGGRSIREARTAFGGRVATSGVPVVTQILIALNIAAYLGELVRSDLVARFDGLGQGLLGPDGVAYVYDGTAYPGFEAVGIAHGEWYRLITSAFLHRPPDQGTFGILHILFNMFALWTLGPAVEAQLGRIRFVSLYLLSALGGSVLPYLIAPHEGGVGASGAVFGLGAAYFVLSKRLRNDPIGGRQLLIGLLVWMAVSAAVTSWQSHLGGLLTGGALGLVLAHAPRRHRGVWQAAGMVVMLLVLVTLVVLKTSQLTGTA
ncbi:rhomboid family intramembrane serine protease [Actinacidiphila glaucinigra]|uniref:rhomboid family intramembrane serine protease n=1 Tax=Actinacidiphila glaucinigra TaxID=235986 RepID=UPI003718FDAE